MPTMASLLMRPAPQVAQQRTVKEILSLPSWRKRGSATRKRQGAQCASRKKASCRSPLPPALQVLHHQARGMRRRCTQSGTNAPPFSAWQQ